MTSLLPIQPKLEVGSAADPLEHEADRVADQVVSGGSAPEISAGAASVARSGGGPAGAEDTSLVEQTVSSGGGAALPEGTRQRMEGAFARDLGGVRVHTDPAAGAAAESVNAQAFTVGNDIYFGRGRYQPGTPSGDRLLAHELTHTIQQASGHAVQRKEGEGEPKLTGEMELNLAIQRVASRYGYLLLKQMEGVGILEAALKTADPPSLSEQALVLAVNTALVAATGALGSMVARGVVPAIQRRLAAVAEQRLRARAGEGDLGGAALQAGMKWAEDRARDAADGMKDAVKGFLRDATKRKAPGVRGLSTIEQFVRLQRDTLIDAAASAEDSFLAVEAPKFFAEPHGIDAAHALRESLEAQHAHAPEEQFIASLREWAEQVRNAKVRDGSSDVETGVFIVSISKATPASPITIRGARWPGLNDATRAELQRDASRTLRSLAPRSMRVEVHHSPPLLERVLRRRARQGGRLVAPSDGMATALELGRGIASPSAGPRFIDSSPFDIWSTGNIGVPGWPRSGEPGYFFLHEVSNANTGSDLPPHTHLGSDTRVQAGAILVWQKILDLTIGQMGEIGD